MKDKEERPPTSYNYLSFIPKEEPEEFFEDESIEVSQFDPSTSLEEGMDDE